MKFSIPSFAITASLFAISFLGSNEIVGQLMEDGPDVSHGSFSVEPGPGAEHNITQVMPWEVKVTVTNNDPDHRVIATLFVQMQKKNSMGGWDTIEVSPGNPWTAVDTETIPKNGGSKELKCSGAFQPVELALGEFRFRYKTLSVFHPDDKDTGGATEFPEGGGYTDGHSFFVVQ